MLLRKHLESFKKTLKRYPKMIIIGFLRRLALCMVGCFKQRHVSLAPHYVSLCMPTHKCSQCFNTGISRAESDLGSRHIFIWEISVPLTGRIKLSKYMKIIYGNCGVKNYMKEDHRSCRRNFCSCCCLLLVGKRKPFAVASITAMILVLSYNCLFIVCINVKKLWFIVSSSSESSLTIRCLKSRVPFLW